MQLLHALALVAALCMGSGAASDLRGAVRAGVDSNNQCTCNFEGGVEGGPLLKWPTSMCECNGACSETCCYFSQPQEFAQLTSYCQCKGEKQTIFDIDTSCWSGGPVKYHVAEIGDNFWAESEATTWCPDGDCPVWITTVPQSWYSSAVVNTYSD